MDNYALEYAQRYAGEDQDDHVRLLREHHEMSKAYLEAGEELTVADELSTQDAEEALANRWSLLDAEELARLKRRKNVEKGEILSPEGKRSLRPRRVR